MSGFQTKPAKLIRLVQALGVRGLDTNLNNYECLGSQTNRCGPLIRDKRLTKNTKHGIISESEIPKITSKCPCGQSIEYNCLIRHLDDKRVLTIGSCCYAAMTITSSRRQICSVDGCSARHSNIKYTVCNDHKKEVKRRELTAKRLEAQKLKELEAYERKMNAIGDSLFGFGKSYYYTRIRDIPDSYVKWIVRNDIRNSDTILLVKFFQFARS